MRRQALDDFACAKCAGALELVSVASQNVHTGEIVEGDLADSRMVVTGFESTR